MNIYIVCLYTFIQPITQFTQNNTSEDINLRLGNGDGHFSLFSDILLIAQKSHCWLLYSAWAYLENHRCLCFIQYDVSVHSPLTCVVFDFALSLIFLYQDTSQCISAYLINKLL